MYSYCCSRMRFYRCITIAARKGCSRWFVLSERTIQFLARCYEFENKGYSDTGAITRQFMTHTRDTSQKHTNMQRKRIFDLTLARLCESFASSLLSATITTPHKHTSTASALARRSWQHSLLLPVTVCKMSTKWGAWFCAQNDMHAPDKTCSLVFLAHSPGRAKPH